jgi:hypothetical protein
MELGIPFALGLASGLLVGWIGHVLAKGRSKEEALRTETLKAINDTIELVEAFADYHIQFQWSSREIWTSAFDRYEAAKRSSYADVELISDSEAWTLLAEYVEAPIPVGPASVWIARVDELRARVVRSLKQLRVDTLS